MYRVAPFRILSTALRGPWTARPTGFRSARALARTAARLASSCPVVTQLLGEHRGGQPAPHGAVVGGGQHVGVAGEDEHRLAEHRQVRGAVGRAATLQGFRKRVLYLDTDVLDESLTGVAVDTPSVSDALLRTRIHQLHQALAVPGSALEAESRLALIGDRIRTYLRELAAAPASDRLADLRDLLDAHTVEGLTLREAAGVLHAHPAHLVRRFTRAFGLPPHRYLTGRRVEAARRLLLDGASPAAVAVDVGFHDQAHLHRHFTRLVGTTPGRYARRA